MACLQQSSVDTGRESQGLAPLLEFAWIRLIPGGLERVSWFAKAWGVDFFSLARMASEKDFVAVFRY